MMDAFEQNMHAEHGEIQELSCLWTELFHSAPWVTCRATRKHGAGRCWALLAHGA